MKHKTILLFATMILVLACAGCGQDAGDNESPYGTGKDPTYGNNGFQTDDEENPSNADKLFEISKLSGRVTEFTETGCTVSPDREGGEGELIGAAAGYEDEGEHVSVLYEPECSFWIAHADIETTTVTYEAATAENVKKQTSLLICGEYDENQCLLANRVFIYRIEGM